MENKKEIKIINLLTSPISETMISFFEKEGIEIYSKSEAESYSKFSYILIDSNHELEELSSLYNVDENEIEFISLSKDENLKDFLLHNGRFQMNLKFAESNIGKIIFKKYLFKQTTIHLDDFLVDDTDITRFNINNHLSVGEDLDQLAIDAFEPGFNVVAIRSYIDHLMYYLMYLKQAGLAGVPFEVEYTIKDDLFVLSVHTSIRNFVAEYLIDSFGSVNADDPLKYLLSIVQKSSDFLDLTYIEDPGKIVFTAYWEHQNAKSLKGIVFNNILTSEQVIAKVSKKIAQHGERSRTILENERFDENKKNKEEELKLKNLPGGILEMVISQDQDSILNSSNSDASNLIAFAVAKFEERNSEKNINEISDEQLNEIYGEYDDQDLIEKLSTKDKSHLKDRIQKSNITGAYGQEIERVRDHLEQDDDFKKVLQNTMNEEAAKRVSSHIDVDVLNRILGSKNIEKSDKQLISSDMTIADDFVTRIKGMDEADRDSFEVRFKNSFEVEAKEMIFTVKGSGNPKMNDNLLMTLINSSIKAVDGFEDIDSDIKGYFKSKGSEKIEKALSDFIIHLGKDTSEVIENDIIRFKSEVLPEVVKKILRDENDIENFAGELKRAQNHSGFEKKFKKNLEEKLSHINSIEKNDDQYIITNDNIDESGVRTLIKDTVKETFDDEFVFSKASKDEIEKKEKEIVVSLSKTLNMDEESVAQIVKGAANSAKTKEAQVVVDNIFQNQPGEENIQVVQGADGVLSQVESNTEKKNTDSSVTEAELLFRIRKSEQEKDRLQSTVDALHIKMKSAAQANSKLQEISAKVSGENIPEDPGVEVASNTAKLIELVEKGGMPPAAAKAVIDALKREQEVVKKAREVEGTVKKLEIETKKKDVLFKSEIEKANKQVRTKEIVLDKAKQSMTNVVSRKEVDNEKLRKQIENLNKQLNNDNTALLARRVKVYEKENQTLARTTEVYRKKLETMAKKVSKLNEKESSRDTDIKDQRALLISNRQFKAKLDLELKAKKILEKKEIKSQELEAELRAQLESVELRLKKQVAEDKEKVISKVEVLDENRIDEIKTLKEGENKALEEFNEKKTSHELDILKSRNSQLEEKLKEVVEKLKNQKKPAASTNNNEKRLEQSVKKLNQELSKTRTDIVDKKKELIKTKSENMSFKNKLGLLEKELSKYKALAEKSKKKKAA